MFLNSAMYMCNGVCIPVIIPCNNTCLDQVEWTLNKIEHLFGPVSCSLPMLNSWGCRKLDDCMWDYDFIASSDNFWTAVLEMPLLEEVLHVLGNTDSKLGVCLPGSIGCNGTCLLDPERPIPSKGQPEIYPWGQSEGHILCSTDKTVCEEGYWFCAGHCISIFEPCEGECQDSGIYPFFCKEEGKCVAKWDTCKNKCVSPERQVWGPWNDYCYEEETDCKIKGPVLDGGIMLLGWQMYMCNGVCIPVIIPCNNTCLDQVEWTQNKIEHLFGPVSCTLPMFNSWGCRKLDDCMWDYDFIASSENFWTGVLESPLLEEVLQVLGNTESKLGVCLPGSIGCNGTCLLDPERLIPSKGQPKIYPLGQSKGHISCSYDKIACEEGYWFCAGHCISIFEPCERTCHYSGMYPKLCEEADMCVGEYEFCEEGSGSGDYDDEDYIS